MKKTIYLSGPITGIAGNNFTAFAKVEEKLNALGHNVLNPHTICQDVNPKDFATPEDYWQYCMRLCVAVMSADAEIVITLDGWENSRGAKKEVNIARELGFIDVQPLVKFLSHAN